MDILSVAVDSWIVQDGNYGDFAVGDKAKFALEFEGSTLRPSASKETVARHLGHSVYEVCAQVQFVDAKVWVIDFGLCAFWESAPPEFAAPGTWVEGELSIGIDPFFYMEYLHKLPGMPDLFYKWHVTSIMRNDTPIPRTDAWSDDEGRSSYVLTVRRDP